MVALTEEIKPAPAKNLLIVPVREVYSCSPGKNADDKLL
jgi:hypothetical protein